MRLVPTACALVMAATLLACGSGSAGPSAARASELPAPNERLPGDAGALASRLSAVSDDLDASIDAWTRHGNVSAGAPPRAVTLQALYVQRAYRLLARRPRLASLTLRRLPARLRPRADDVVTALHDLMRLTPPTRAHRLRTGPPAPAGRLLSYYRLAQRRFRISWQVLASVNFVESAFGRFRNSSSAGAQGPMQFLPATWRVYGLGGDINSPRDAILGAANYLHRSGAPGSYRHALFAYNPSSLYVDAVLRFARVMARDRRAFLGFYSWQVFVRTPAGERRITGP